MAMPMNQVIEEVKGMGYSVNHPDYNHFVVMIYGIHNETVSRNKIAKATGILKREVDLIIDECWRNNLIQKYSWTF